MIVWDLSFQVYADIMPEPEESTVIQTIIADTVETVTESYLNGKTPSFMYGGYGVRAVEKIVPKTRQ
jgi:hypothetical protein